MKYFVLFILSVISFVQEANAQITVDVNSQPMQFNGFDITVKSIEMSQKSTIVYKIVNVISQDISVWSTKDECIVDPKTGKKYNIMDSSLGFTPYESQSPHTGKYAIVEVYPPIPGGVTKINITSDGTNNYVKNLSIGSKRSITSAEQSIGIDEYNKGQNLAGNNQWTAAFTHYEKAARTIGLADAQFETALGYERGEGTKTDFPEAFYWMYKSSINNPNNGNSYLYLGLYYREGTGTLVNYHKSLEYFKAGAEKCIFKDFRDECSFYVGIAYQYGLGLAKDLVIACKWYRKAAEQGHAVAAHNLGNRYAYGEGVAKDFNEAAKWWTVAAQKGYINAQMNLGRLYRQGEQGVAKNKKKALYWYKQAADKGNTKALIAIQEIENE